MPRDTEEVMLGRVSAPDGRSGNWEVKTFQVSELDSAITSIRAMRSSMGADAYVPPGTYKKLTCSGKTVMSNTPMEIRSNNEFCRLAHGDVLICGLGLGMVVEFLLSKPDVRSVTVIELSEDVISLVWPTFAHDSRATVIQADALTLDLKTLPLAKYDFVWHDIWTYIDTDNLVEMKKLHRKFGKRAGWQASWMRRMCEQVDNRRTKRRRSYW